MRRLLPLLLLCGCPKAVTAPREAARVPAAKADPCAADLSGPYVHSTDPSYVYDARDDGGTVLISVSRRFDGGSPDAGLSATMVLSRFGDAGFRGEVRALGGLPSGQTCELGYPVRVTGCVADGLTLQAAADGVIGEGCLTPARPRNPVMLDHKLTRADAGGKRLSP